MTAPRLHYSSPAFNMIEVCVSLAIVAFCVLALMGLFSGGLGQLQKTMEGDRGRAMARQIVAEAKLQSFSDLKASASYQRYFTADGDRATSPGGRNVLYTANITVVATNQVPGVAGGAPAPVVTLAVAIYKAPDGDFQTKSPFYRSVSVIGPRELSPSGGR